MKLILLCGKAESGKSTSADFIKKYLEENHAKVIKTKMTKYLRLYAKEITGYNEETDEKPRDLLQNLGDIVRSIDINFLLKRLDEDIKVYSRFADYIIIDDIRFALEVNFFKERYDCLVFKLERNKSNNLTSKQRKHSTETGLDDFNDYDKVIDNNGSLEDLENKLRKYLGEYYEFKR